MEEITYRLYSKEEIAYIKENYDNTFESVKAIANKLNRTTSSVRSKIQNLFLASRRKRETIEFKADLTPREKEVYQEILLGKSGKDIAKSLNISMGTYFTHRNNIFYKMHVNSVIELLAKKIKELETIGREDVSKEDKIKSVKAKLISIRLTGNRKNDSHINKPIYDIEFELIKE